MKTAVWWKAQLLSNGVAIDKTVLDNYDSNYIEKRSAYGIQDPVEYKSLRIPQELFILPDEIVCAINVNPYSEYRLYYAENESAYFLNYRDDSVKVTFPVRPEFYNKMLSNSSTRVNQVVTLYGGHSIGAFLVRNCWIEKNGVCHFCSLCNNHGQANDFLSIIDDSTLEEAVFIALQEDYPFTQIMLNGGNIANLDDNFMFYIDKVKRISNLLHKLGRKDIELHLIVSPPKNLDLLEQLRGLNVKVAMNMETYDDELFKKYCPGKEKYIGHAHILNALKKCVNVLGSEHVYSIFVGGLEPIEFLEKGIQVMQDNGIVPVINILHVDPDTLMSEDQRPSPEYILQVGRLLQNAYSKYSSSFIPFYYKCGRNSIDSEAFLNLF